MIFESQTGTAYGERRPTPATKPGAACESPFGLGVNAVRQDDHQPPDPTSPGIDWAPLVEGAGGDVSGSDSQRRGAAASRDEPLPATGAGAGAGLIATFLVGAAAWLRSRR